MKILKWLGAIIILLVIVYFVGPKVDVPELDAKITQEATSDLKALEDEINKSEASNSKIKPDNQARIIWADSTHQKTPYSLVYLHGFSASQGEGDPAHIEFARRYGCNLYLTRLAEHGLESDEPMLELTPEKLLESAKEAIAVGKQLGDQVIVMSTSTGGTLGIYLASEEPAISALINYSPNIDLFDPRSSMLLKPWGLQIARTLLGGDYNNNSGEPEEDKFKDQYWYAKYRIEAILNLKALMAATMTEETFTKVKQPFFLGYYYKNDSLQDKTVSVPKMLEMYDQLGTPEASKRKVAFPEAKEHVIASKYVENTHERVMEETFKFAEEILKLEPQILHQSDSAALLVP
ncbi:MAG: alpha/beta hydrolase [Bacteroidota bacterium]